MGFKMYFNYFEPIVFDELLMGFYWNFRLYSIEKNKIKHVFTANQKPTNFH